MAPSKCVPYRRTSSSPSKRGGNAIISRGRNYEQMGTGKSEKGSTREQAIELDDEDELEDGSTATPVRNSPQLKAKKEEPEIKIIRVKTEITHVRMNEPSRAPVGLRPNPLPLNAGAVDQPIQLLDSDSDDDCVALPAPPLRQPKGVVRTSLIQSAKETMGESGRASNVKREQSPLLANPVVHELSDSSEGEVKPLDFGRHSSDAESSKPLKRSRTCSPGNLSPPTGEFRSLSLKAIVHRRGFAYDPSETEDWKDYHAGFPSVSLVSVLPVKEEEGEEDQKTMVVEEDAREADAKTAFKEQLRLKELVVNMETTRAPLEVLTVFMDRRGQSISAPDFPWDFADVGPALSLKRTPNMLLDRSSITQTGNKIELVRQGEGRALRVIRELVGTSGAIWATDQSRNGTVAVAAAVAAGEEQYRRNDEDYVLNAYNKPGNLGVWMMTEEDSDDEERSTDEVNVLHEHIFRDVFDPGLGATRPHYATVFGVAFDPFTDDSFVSSGADGTVRKWDRPDPEKPHVNTHTWTFDKHPHHLVFHGGEKIFAVGGSDGRVYVHSGQDYTTQYYIEGSNPDRQVSSMTWGKASCSSTVFFATEHTGQNQNDGEAYAANYVAGNHKTMYNFSGVPGGGAVMALDGTGSRLAIVAGQRSNMARQSLLVYEPQVLDAQTVLECHLPEFGYITHPPSLSDECHIMDVQFSPCGRYIAIARDNNCALIYDIRNATLPLHVFGHVTYSREEMEHRFGIRGGTQATYGIASLGWMGHDTLITGGSDGCVRRWDTRRATERMGGQVVARLDQPVAHLSFGDDTQQHRYPLIAGDMEGKVYVFDYKVGHTGSFII